MLFENSLVVRIARLTAGATSACVLPCSLADCPGVLAALVPWLLLHPVMQAAKPSSERRRFQRPMSRKHVMFKVYFLPFSLREQNLFYKFAA